MCKQAQAIVVAISITAVLRGRLPRRFALRDIAKMPRNGSSPLDSFHVMPEKWDPVIDILGQNIADHHCQTRQSQERPI
jgi:hypothetical protein